MKITGEMVQAATRAIRNIRVKTDITLAALDGRLAYAALTAALRDVPTRRVYEREARMSEHPQAGHGHSADVPSAESYPRVLKGIYTEALKSSYQRYLESLPEDNTDPFIAEHRAEITANLAVAIQVLRDFRAYLIEHTYNDSCEYVTTFAREHGIDLEGTSP